MATPNFVNITNVGLDDIHTTLTSGTTGTQVALDDSDLRTASYTHPEFNDGGLNTTAGTEIAIGQFRGASDIQVSAGSFSGTTPFSAWGTTSQIGLNAEASCRMRWTLQTANSRVKCYMYSGGTQTGWVERTRYINYVNCEGNSVDFQCRCDDDSEIINAGAGSTISGTFNSWISMTNGVNVDWYWATSSDSSNLVGSIENTEFTTFSFRVRFTVGGDYLYFPTSTTSVDSTGKPIDLSTLHGGGSGGGIEPF